LSEYAPSRHSPNLLRRPTVLTSAFFGAAALLATTAVALTAQPSADTTRTALDRVFSRYSSREGPGCSAAASREGRTVYEAGYGSAMLEADVPITPASIFHAASISKQFTAFAIQLLARDGKLSLDDDIRKHLPEIPDYGHKITIRHLLNHTSGLRDQWDLLSLARGRFEEERITEADVLDIVSRQKALNFTPGTEYLYSNSGYTLAGTIVARVSGKSLRQFADDRIFKPLGMTGTHFHDDFTMVVKGRTLAYSPRPDGSWRFSIPNFDTYGATSLFTTVGDLLKWQENFRRPVVGDDAMFREMQTTAVLVNGDSTGYGLGITMGGPRGRRLVGHSGADAGYRAYTGRYPEHGLAVAVLCNAATANPAALSDSIAKVYLGAGPAGPAAPAAGKTKPTTEELGRVAGVYVNRVTGSPTFISVKDGNLIVGQTNGPTLVPVTATRFWFAPQSAEWEFRPTGELVATFRGQPPRQPLTLVKRTATRPSAADLARYAGSFYSEELGATYIVSAGDTALTFRTRTNPPRTMTHAYGDTFLGFALIEFQRNASGQVTGLLMSTGRTRKVRFDKTR
jgi:CubicO group peptidase (beta-lactamase class C family)